MLHPFHKMRKSDRRASLVLGFVVVCGIISNLVIALTPQEVTPTSDEDRKRLEDFLASVERVEKSKRSYQNYSYSHQSDKEPIVLKPFDPNTIDSLSLVQMGLPSFIARNIMKYRSKGGKFRTPEAFAAVYGLRKEQYEQLRPYIHINEADLHKKDTVFPTHHKDSSVVYKYPEGTLVELNSADTTELKKIPGIGSGLARMIVSYRQRLGGYYTASQVKEIEYMPEGVERWFTIKTAILQPIHINKATIPSLRNHPYFNFYQAKRIVEHRRKYGKIKSLSELSLYTEFTRKDFERISPYLVFD